MESLLRRLPIRTAASAGNAATAQPVLGSPSYPAPYGEATSSRRGLTPIFRPGGGYYARPGRIKLRAESLCSAS